DEAHLGYRPFSFKKVIERFHPDVVVFGYDQDKIRGEFMREVAREGWRVRVVKAPKMSSAKLNSSSKVLARIARLLSIKRLKLC
ncbi:MAG: nucleotidyltransferase, partial [Nitrososphaerota archaeon]